MGAWPNPTQCCSRVAQDIDSSAKENQLTFGTNFAFKSSTHGVINSSARDFGSLFSDNTITGIFAMNLGETAKALSISIMLSATDVHGKRCEQSVIAYDLSQQGARLDGICETLAPGTRVTLQYKDAIASAQIVWVVASSGTEVCQAGVRLVDPRKCPWKSALADPATMLRLPDRRKGDRYKLSVGVQLTDEGKGVAMQASTVDIGLGGCYVETLFPSAVGASLKVLLWLGDDRLLSKGIVRASCPGVGMGIEFLDLSWEETERLYRFLEASRTRLR